MKPKLITLALIVMSSFILSTKTFAQPDSGGLDGGDGNTTPPEGAGTVASTYTFNSYSFKRNNGNGSGVCGYNAQIRVAFDPMPTNAADIPNLTSVIYKSSNLIANGYAKVINAQIVSQTQPYVSYCVQGIENLPGASDGNIQPAEKIILKFNNQ